MKTLWTSSAFTTASAFALGVMFVTPAFAQQAGDSKKDQPGTVSAPGKSATASTAASETNARVQIATNDAKERTDAKLTGREVKGSDGKELGNIKDLLISPTTGQVDFAVISTGGVAGIGDKLRLVPMASMRPAGKKDFSVAIDKASWDQIAPFANDAYKADTIMLTDAEHRQIAAHFAGAKAGRASSDAVAATPSTARLVKASDLHGKEVRSAGREVGKIEGLVIDPAQATAQALFEPKRDFAGTTEKFVVPLNQFVIGGGHEAASALLTSDAFAEAIGRSPVSSSSTGTLPVTSSTPATTNTDRDAQIATTSITTNDKSHDLAAAPKANSSQPSSPSSTQGNVASNGDSAQQKNSTASSAGGTTTSDLSLSRTDRADTNGVNPAAVTSNSTTNPAAQNPEAAAQADAKSPTSSPPNRSEQGQDIASTVPASPSSKAGPAGQPGNQPAMTNSSAPNSTGLAASSTPSRGSTPDKNPPAAGASASDQNLTPTGKTSADQLPSNDPALNSAALSVRKALDDSPSLARLNVAVTPESGKVVIRGTVATAQLKTAVEDTARRAAKDKMIDSEVTIEGQ